MTNFASSAVMKIQDEETKHRKVNFLISPYFHPAMAVGGEGSDPCFI